MGESWIMEDNGEILYYMPFYIKSDKNISENGNVHG